MNCRFQKGYRAALSYDSGIDFDSYHPFFRQIASYVRFDRMIKTSPVIDLVGAALRSFGVLVNGWPNRKFSQQIKGIQQ